MMFSGLLLKQRSAVRGVALIGLFVAIVLNVMEAYGFHLFKINITGMMYFDRFSLFFNTIAMGCTFIFFLLSGKEMEKVGLQYSDYFALIFFILCGIVLSSSFSSFSRFWILHILYSPHNYHNPNPNPNDRYIVIEHEEHYYTTHYT